MQLKADEFLPLSLICTDSITLGESSIQIALFEMLKAAFPEKTHNNCIKDVELFVVDGQIKAKLQFHYNHKDVAPWKSNR